MAEYFIVQFYERFLKLIWDYNFIFSTDKRVRLTCPLKLFNFEQWLDFSLVV